MLPSPTMDNGNGTELLLHRKRQKESGSLPITYTPYTVIDEEAKRNSRIAKKRWIGFSIATLMGFGLFVFANRKVERSVAEATKIHNFIKSISMQPLSYPSSQVTPQEKALHWLIEEDLTTKASNIVGLRQRYALVTLWYANAPAHTANWLTSRDVCSWESVGSCINGEITRMDLERGGLSQNIPTEVGLLTALTSLTLHRNHLTGTIPSALASLMALETLSLWDNQLTGSIPSEFASMTKLTDFRVQGNRLTGTMPYCNGSSHRLKFLYADCKKMNCPCCTLCL